jgi:hypothetical protein
VPADFESLTAQKDTINAQLLMLRRTAALRTESTTDIAVKLEGLRGKRDVQAQNYKAAKIAIGTLTESATKHDQETQKFLTVQECCPTCYASGSEWKQRWKQSRDDEYAKLLKTIHEHEVALDAARVAGTQFKQKRGELELVLERMRTDDTVMGTAEKQLAQIEDKLQQVKDAADKHTAAQHELADLRQDIQKNEAEKLSIAERLATAQSLYQKAKEQDALLASLEKQHDDAAAALKDAQAAGAAYKSAQAQLFLLPAAGVEAAVAAHSRQEEAVAKQQEAIASLEQQMNAVTLARADLKRQMEAVAAAEASQASVDVLKAVKDLLEERQATLVSKAFGGLLAVVNEFTSAIIPYPIQYKDNEIGYFTEQNVWVSTATFNGAWELILYIAFCVALASQAEQRICILDECSRLGGANKRLVLQRMSELIRKGIIHQCIMVDVLEERKVGSNYQLVVPDCYSLAEGSMTGFSMIRV